VSYDLEALVTGKAIYGMMLAWTAMVYASVEHPPVLGGKVKSYDDKEALKVAGVRQTVPIDPFQQAPAFQPLGGIAVIADNTVGGVSRPQEAEHRMGQRTKRNLQLGGIQERIASDLPQSLQSSAQYR